MTTLSADDRLQRYYDADLPEDEADAVAREVEADSELSAKLRGLEHLSAMLKASAEPHLENPDFEFDSEALFSAIISRVEAGEADDDGRDFLEPLAASLGGATTATEAADRPALRVLEGGRTDSGPVEGADSVERVGRDGAAGAAAKATSRPASGRSSWWVASGVGLAAAAAIAFFVTRPDPAPLADDPDPVIAEVLPARAPSPDLGSEIEDVDFGYNTGAIFSVEGDEGEQYAVVWISDEKVDEEAIQ